MKRAAIVDSSTLEMGRNPLSLRAKDAAGNWGPVSARVILLGAPTCLPLLLG